VAISLNSKFIIGRYIYCTQERFLYLDGEPINIEPKMADVLDYLLLNTERYVPLQELHDEVWAGRIVTDTAVRRVVSRLRSLIEADASKPEIIKSLPKRGYRLFSMPASAELVKKHLETSNVETNIDLVEPSVTTSAEQVSTLETNVSQTADEDDQTGATQGASVGEEEISSTITDATDEPISNQDNKVQQSTPTRSTHRYGLWVLVISLLLIACIGVLYVTNQPNNLEPHVDKVEDRAQTTELVLSHFESLPQNSRLLAISKSGELAIYEKAGEDGSYELYLHKIQQGKQWLLAANYMSVGYAAFVDNDNALLLSFNAGTPTEGSIQLWYLNQTNQVTGKRVLISDIQGATSVVSGDKANTAFVAISSFDAQYKYEFYRVSWDKDESFVQKKITASNNNQSFDIQGTLSADKKYLAYVRRTRLDHEQEIQILELATGKITKRIPWRQETRALAWQNEKKLLVLNKQNLTSINLDSDRNTELFVNLDSSFWSMYIFDNKIYLYKRKSLYSRYVELVFVNGKYHTLHRERSTNSVSLAISQYTKNQWYEITKEANKYHLSLIDLDNPEKDKKIFSADEYFIILDESKRGELLIKVGDRAGVLNQNGKVSFINTEQQMLDDAVFDRDGVNIIYSMFSNNKWTINFLDIESMKSTLVREGFISIRVTNELYFFWSENNELFKSETLFSELTPLSVNGSFLQPPPWKVAYPNIYWIDFDTNKVVLNKFNVVECDKQVIDISLTRGFYFSVSDNNILLESANDRSSSIYVIDNIK
jgi:DNA-binding winged helix-turn-helix (wHTH) protein